jgi:hypothetical protein
MAETTKRPKYRNSMCPTGLALAHPGAPTLQEYGMYGCPAKTGKPWTKAEIWEAVEWGPHVLALLVEVLKHSNKKHSRKWPQAKQRSLIGTR